jgi:hypothetical protein
MTILLRKSIAIVCLFFLFPAALFAQIIKQYQFSPSKFAPDDTAYQNYLVKNDGTLIEGKEVKWKLGNLAKQEAIIDGVSYPESDLRGAHLGKVYYGKVARGQLTQKNALVKRVVHGKLNIYMLEGRTSQNEFWYLYYSQVGDSGDINLLSTLDELKSLVSDCSVTANMLDKSNEEAKKALRKEKGYLNRVVETYNNDCKALTE